MSSRSVKELLPSLLLTGLLPLVASPFLRSVLARRSNALNLTLLATLTLVDLGLAVLILHGCLPGWASGTVTLLFGAMAGWFNYWVCMRFDANLA